MSLLLAISVQAQDTIPNPDTAVVLTPDSLATVDTDSFSYSLDTTNYIVNNAGEQIYGQIKNSTKIHAAKEITFKDKAGNEIVHTPTTIKAWQKDGKLYKSKTYRVNKQKTMEVFMEQLSPDNGTVQVYDFHNNFIGTFPIVQTFLEESDEMTLIKKMRFRKQMEEYFEGYPTVVALIKSDKLKRKNLLELVKEYNDLLNDNVQPIAPPPPTVVDTNTIEEKTWSLEDLMLSPDEAIQKYLALLEAEVAGMTNIPLKNLIINYRLGSIFFEQNQYATAKSYLRQAVSILNRYTNSGTTPTAIDPADLEAIVNYIKEHELSLVLPYMLGQVFLDKGKLAWAIKHNSNALMNKTSNAPWLNYRYLAYKNAGTLFKKLASSSQNIDWYAQFADDNERDWQQTIKKRGLTTVVHGGNNQKSTGFNLALICYDKALELTKELPNKISKQIDVYIKIGTLFFDATDYSNARKYYKKASDLMQRHYPNKHPQEAEVTRILSEIFLAEQLYNEALIYIEKAQNMSLGEDLQVDDALLENINKIPFPFELLNSIATKGIILYKKNLAQPSEQELQKVLAHYAVATKLLHTLRNTHRNEGSNYKLASITHKFSQHGVMVCNALYELTQKPIYLEEAFHYSELSKSAVLYEVVHDLKYMEVSGIPKDQINKESGFKAQISYLKSEIFYELQKGSKRDKERLEAMRTKLKSIEQAHQLMLDNFEQKYPKYHNLKYNHQLATLKDLQQNLASDEVFLEYVVTDSFIYVLAIGKDSIASQLKMADFSLAYNLSRLHNALKNNLAKVYQQESNLLYPFIIGKLSSFLKGKKLIISPDAELHYIPFGVLPARLNKQQGGKAEIYGSTTFLIEEHPICYNYSASIYLLNKKRNFIPQAERIATWAPNFENMDSILRDRGLDGGLDPLPGAHQEAQDIAAMFFVNPFVDFSATETNFKSLANQYSVLHIATHGILNDDDPLFSSLVMSTDSTEDGILHAFELYNMQLNADLAVLSACNSGMGKLTKGEGVVSIARGFAYAGVPNIVMSKWAVSDWSTAVLMKAFYKNIKKGMPKDEALQQAKVFYLEANKDEAKLLAPFYWGGFVLLGDTAPIQTLIMEDTPWGLYIGILIAVLVVVLAVWKYYKK